MPVDTSTGVTRCKYIQFGNGDPNFGKDRDNMKRRQAPTSVGGRSLDSPGLVQSSVAAKAATVADQERGKGVDADTRRFVAWTKRLCGLSPQALVHLQDATVGGFCPKDVPVGMHNLKWYSSAVAGKMNASPHPQRDASEVTRYREKVGMDFLEFTINGKKFHGLGFVDYKTTSGDMHVQNRI